jgi:hypothetical protein
MSYFMYRVDLWPDSPYFSTGEFIQDGPWDQEDDSGGVMSLNLREDGALVKAQEIAAHNPPRVDQDAAGKEGEIKKIAEKLVDELTDYICGHVTESLKPIQAVIEIKSS